MENEYTVKIRKLMKEFSQHYRSEEEKQRKLTEVKCPIEPDLMGYTFDKILGFDVKYRVFEKVNYVIVFKYKNTVGTLGHYKLSFRLNVEESVKEEILKILNDVKLLLENALLKYAEEAVKKNKYSLPNYFIQYKNKIDLLSENILNIPDRLKQFKLEEENEKKIRKEEFSNIVATHEFIEDEKGNSVCVETSWGKFLKKYWTLERNLSGELSYTIELYIENWFSFIEHTFSLLLPMTEYYNSNDEYSNYLMANWRTKVEKIFGDDKSMKPLVESLSKIKEIYRNRFSHGMFSREKKVNIQIPNFGMYPLWIGKNHCKGFSGTTDVLTLEIYSEVKNVFEDFFSKVKNRFPLQFKIIESDIPTFLDTSLYDKAFSSEAENKNYIEAYWYYHDNAINMDW